MTANGNYFYDRIKETSTSTGTGNMSLTPITGPPYYETFNSFFLDDEPVYYAIVALTTNQAEVGIGHLTASGGQLVRDQVLWSSTSSTLVNFSAGTKDVFNTIPAELANNVTTIGQVVALISGAAMP